MRTQNLSGSKQVQSRSMDLLSEWVQQVPIGDLDPLTHTPLSLGPDLLTLTPDRARVRGQPRPQPVFLEGADP